MKTLKLLAMFFVLSVGILSLAIEAQARPPRPAPHCVWIDGFYTRDGYFIQGHWSCSGPPVRGRTWVPGYYEDEHRWREGYWDRVPPRPHRRAFWVPGHFDMRGRWVPGHWE